MGDSAVHDGIFKSNLTLSRRREDSSVAFGKVAVGNEFLGNAFFRNDALQRCKEAGNFIKVNYYQKCLVTFWASTHW